MEEVTEAEDLWLQSLERKNPDKKPRTADARPVSRAIVTAWNSKDHCESLSQSDIVLSHTAAAYHGQRQARVL